MLNCFALTVTRLQNDKKMLFLRKQVGTYLLEFRKRNTFHILHQGVNSQCFRRESFQLRSLAR